MEPVESFLMFSGLHCFSRSLSLQSSGTARLCRDLLMSHFLASAAICTLTILTRSRHTLVLCIVSVVVLCGTLL